MHVGLLEDDISIQEMLLLVFQDEGYTVTNYPDAEGCIEALKRAGEDGAPVPVDLMIVDWRLSGLMTGTEVIQQIRSNFYLSTLPIILTTAATFNDMTALQDLQVSLLQKPFAVDDMISLINNLTQSQSSNS
ncbi:MAG: response regulator transcription factor [Ktedonobacteraceae bacterium]|nr:response regulator transcription factor [Ktedonobacteraceae bacterium]